MDTFLGIIWQVNINVRCRVGMMAAIKSHIDLGIYLMKPEFTV